jgi:hypothetical protein
MARFLNDDIGTKKVIQALEMPAEIWHKLEELADEATKSQARSVSPSEVASAILRRYLAER